MTEHTVPTPDAGLSGIAAGLDGAFGSRRAPENAVGRITLEGHIDEIPLGRGDVADGDRQRARRGDLVQRARHNQVGRLNLGSAAADETAPVVTVVLSARRLGPDRGRGDDPPTTHCTDEPGGSGVTPCDGPVPDGEVVPNGAGSHVFTVTGTDAGGQHRHRVPRLRRVQGDLRADHQ